MWPEEMYGKAPMKRLFKRLPIDGLTSKEVAKAMDDLSGLLWSYRLAELEPRVLPFAIRYRPEPRGELLLLLSALAYVGLSPPDCVVVPSAKLHDRSQKLIGDILLIGCIATDAAL